ncbi:Glutamate carboxypeptidase 2, partial [Lamellibrachia satsuma]
MEDFLWLKDNKYVNFTGKICIARYGKIFRGDKAKHAQLFGASGLILYSDPKDYSASKTHSVYPDSWWLPGTGVQRGSLNMDVDPLTPGYPGTESAYYLPNGEEKLLKIPVHPIGFDDAKIFMENIQMFISTHNENRTTYNVVGFIEGAIE